MTKLVIIGSGPGGYTAAIRAAQLGLRVTVIEKALLGGVCLNSGCIPTKTLLNSAELFGRIRDSEKYGITVEHVKFNLPQVVLRQKKIVENLQKGLEFIFKKHHIEFIKGFGKILAPDLVEVDTGVSKEKIKADKIILAAGSVPVKKWAGENVITSDEALKLNEIPKSLLVTGTGAVGVELAYFYAEIGSQVTLIEMMPQILPDFDTEIAKILKRELKKKKIKVICNTAVKEIKDSEVIFSNGESRNFDLILSAVGRQPDTQNLGLENVGIVTDKGKIKTNEFMQTNIPNIYAIGDIVADSPMLAHKAFAEGMVAASNCAGFKKVINYKIVPECIYTSPEVASVGLKEDQLKEPKISKIPFRILGKAHTSGRIEGLIKLVADIEGRLKGAQIIGPQATELIHQAAIIIKLCGTIEEMSELIWAHPTYSEIYSEAFHNFQGQSIHYYQG